MSVINYQKALKAVNQIDVIIIIDNDYFVCATKDKDNTKTHRETGGPGCGAVILKHFRSTASF